MTIRWFRNAKGKRVLTPRRDKPKSTKNLPIKKKKDLGRPRFPKVEKPLVSVPFVSALNCGHIHRDSFKTNVSESGVLKVNEILESTILENGHKLIGGEVTWIRGPEQKGECTEINGAAVCDTYSLGYQPWKNFNGFMTGRREPALKEDGSDVIQDAGRETGIWRWSHINCTCHVRVRLFDPTNPDKYLLYEIYTDPSQGADQGVTANAGYALVQNSGINPAVIKSIDIEEVTILNKQDSGAEVPSEPLIPTGMPEPEAPGVEPKPEPEAAVEEGAEPAADVPTQEVEEEPKEAPLETYEQRQRRLEEEADAKRREEEEAKGLPEQP